MGIARSTYHAMPDGSVDDTAFVEPRKNAVDEARAIPSFGGLVRWDIWERILGLPFLPEGHSAFEFIGKFCQRRHCELDVFDARGPRISDNLSEKTSARPTEARSDDRSGALFDRP